MENAVGQTQPDAILGTTTIASRGYSAALSHAHPGVFFTKRHTKTLLKRYDRQRVKVRESRRSRFPRTFLKFTSPSGKYRPDNVEAHVRAFPRNASECIT